MARDTTTHLHRSKPASSLERANALERLPKNHEKDNLRKLLNALTDTSPLVRVAAVEGLGTLRKTEALSHLAASLGDANAEVRMRAAEGIGLIIKSGRSPSALVKSLEDPDELVRIAVVISLGRIRDVKTLPALRKVISDKSALVRRYVSVAVAKFGRSEDVRKLQRALNRERSETARLGYYQALYLLGKKDLLFEMLKLLTSKDYRIRCAAAHTLSEIPVDRFQRQLVVAAIHERYRAEETVAAKSSFRTALARLTNKSSH